ncbi:PREDICTED: zinc finger protein 64 [Nanorana parkeri]|uniref:zinc finger protein 64 n=1 Tax=Nanorana parkeri TaxID=125878 RepID=UPI0008547DA8|nr:PREDICTED: zinc finger protein 64 [Nanorana parkeri]
MNPSAAAEGLPAVQFSGTATVLVEITADIHICGLCKTQFNNLDAFVAHKQSGCQLTNAATGATTTVQFVSGESVTPSQPVARTITSETQTITVSAPEFVFEHGYQTFLPSDSSVAPPIGGVTITTKSRSKKISAASPQKKQSCTYPGCQFKTAYGMKDMERHMRTHTGDKPHRCDTCGKCFSRKDKLKTHIRSHTGEKPYKCKECDYSAADSSSLCKHMRIHTDERPFKCQICPYASRNSSQLTVHLRSHTGDAPFQCMLCSSKFKINSDLRRHMRVHTGEKPYRCEFCDFFCAMKGNLKSHIRMKHNAECTFKCTQCNFQCSSKGDLRQHLRTHLPELPVKCLECNYSCANRAALKVHERIHSQDRPFKCHLCQFDTKQRSNLTTHIKKVHGDDVNCKFDAQKTEGNFPRQYGSRKSNKVEAKKTFRCDLCEASFVREDSLRSHKRQHNEIMLQKSQELSMLQLSVDQSRQSDVDKSDKDDAVTAFIVGKMKVGDEEELSGASLTNADSSSEERNGPEAIATDQLHMLSHVNLMASPQSLGSQVIVCETVVPGSPGQDSEDSIQEVLIENGEESDPESSENPTFISESGMSCSDLDGLNALIQEETTVVIVDSEGGDNPGVSSPIYGTSPKADSPKQTYTIEEGDASSELLCPADSIPD